MRPQHPARHHHPGRWPGVAPWRILVVAALAVPALAVASPAAAVPPAGACTSLANPGTTITARPWAQQVLGPDRAWLVSTGANVTVAVVDSGVDAGHPQLAGRVLKGYDFLRATAGADFDCASHGTAVASVIAARHIDGIGFEGIAPDVRILPVRVSEHEPDGQGAAVTPAVFAKAIRYAADQGAEVINISLTLDTDVAAVHDAIDYAVKTKDCVVVAAVGNGHKAAAGGEAASGSLGSGAGDGDPPSYPAAYPGVIGVGAVDQSGARLGASQVGRYVTVVAPGAAVLAATRGSGYAYWDGTSLAAPMVSAVAALLRSAFPRLSAAEVAARLIATADPVPGSRHEVGYGMVDPYRALTEQVPAAASGRPAQAPPADTDPVATARATSWHRAAQRALIAGLGTLALATGISAMAVAVRRGRRRAWQPGRPPVPAPRNPVAEPEHEFFALPRRPG